MDKCRQVAGDLVRLGPGLQGHGGDLAISSPALHTARAGSTTTTWSRLWSKLPGPNQFSHGLIIFLGIYGGVATRAEAAALAALYAFLVSTLFCRSVSLRLAYDTVRHNARSTAS